MLVKTYPKVNIFDDLKNFILDSIQNLGILPTPLINKYYARNPAAYDVLPHLLSWLA